MKSSAAASNRKPAVLASLRSIVALTGQFQAVAIARVLVADNKGLCIPHGCASEEKPKKQGKRSDMVAPGPADALPGLRPAIPWDLSRRLELFDQGLKLLMFDTCSASWI